MASFSPKKYFKKIGTPSLITKYYSAHDVEAHFPITEGTPRKQIVDMLIECHKNLPPEKKIIISQELAVLDTVSNKQTTLLLPSIFKEHKVIKNEDIECITDADKMLHAYIYHNDVFNEILFLNDFYKNRSYMIYEAPEIDIKAAEYNLTELSKELARILNTEERTTDCDITGKVLNNILYVSAVFDGLPEITPTRNNETGELDRSNVRRKVEQIRFVYLPHDKEVLIAYKGNKQEKNILLDTFLRIVCGGKGFEDKVESFNLEVIKEKNFDFLTTKKNIPLLTWKIKAVTLAFGGDEKFKKKIRITLPSSIHSHGLTPLYEVLEEIGLPADLESFAIENVSFMFSFTDKTTPDATINTACAISLLKSSLCPLFEYERLSRTLLKQSGIDEGFIEQSTKEKDEVTKKWEV
jgi:hypothetical protein